MKAIFLDIDGVMTSNSLKKETLDHQEGYPFSEECVSTLNDILITHKVKIILTSSWRNVFSVEKQSQIFRDNGVLQVPYDQTEDLGYENRSDEIGRYLESKKIEKFVILDDMVIEGFDGHYVQIDPNVGLSAHYLNQINELLS